MVEVGRLDLELTCEVFIDAPRSLIGVVKHSLKAAPNQFTRSVYDLDANVVYGIAHPPIVTTETVDGRLRPRSLDELRGWLDAESMQEVADVLYRCRRLSLEETAEYEAIFRPPHAPAFMWRIVCRPLMLYGSGRVWLLQCDAEALPV